MICSKARSFFPYLAVSALGMCWLMAQQAESADEEGGDETDSSVLELVAGAVWQGDVRGFSTQQAIFDLGVGRGVTMTLSSAGSELDTLLVLEARAVDEEDGAWSEVKRNDDALGLSSALSWRGSTDRLYRARLSWSGEAAGSQHGLRLFYRLQAGEGEEAMEMVEQLDDASVHLVDGTPHVVRSRWAPLPETIAGMSADYGNIDWVRLDLADFDEQDVISLELAAAATDAGFVVWKMKQGVEVKEVPPRFRQRRRVAMTGNGEGMLTINFSQVKDEEVLWVAVYSGSQESSDSFELSLDRLQMVDNDEPLTARLLEGELPLVDEQSVVGARVTNVEGTLDALIPAVWHRYQVLDDGRLVMGTQGSSYDTYLAVYQRDQQGELELLAANDDVGADGTHSELELDVQQGQNLFICTGALFGTYGELVLRVNAVQEED